MSENGGDKESKKSIGMPTSSAWLATESWKTDLKEDQARRHKRSLQQTNCVRQYLTGNILPTPAAVAVDGIVATGRHAGQSTVRVTAAVMPNGTAASAGVGK